MNVLKGGSMNTSVINEPQLLVTVSDPTMLTKLKDAIKMLNGVKFYFYSET